MPTTFRPSAILVRHAAAMRAHTPRGRGCRRDGRSDRITELLARGCDVLSGAGSGHPDDASGCSVGAVGRAGLSLLGRRDPGG